MAKGKNNQQAEVEIPDGGPLPGETLPAQAATAENTGAELMRMDDASLAFETVTDRKRDRFAPFERPIVTPEIGETFTFTLVDLVPKGDGEDELEFDAILVRAWPGRGFFYLPAHLQLWEFFANERNNDEAKHKVYQVTQVERIPDKKNPEKVGFVRYRIAEAKRPK